MFQGHGFAVGVVTDSIGLWHSLSCAMGKRIASLTLSSGWGMLEMGPQMWLAWAAVWRKWVGLCAGARLAQQAL